MAVHPRSLRRPPPLRPQTGAAASYLKDLYRTDAQVQGFLVMAARANFWQLTKYKGPIPQETHNFVFYIASAALIGELPAVSASFLTILSRI